MGLQRRRKSGNIFGGSKLNVDGQGIYTVKIIPNDPIPIKSKFPKKQRVSIPSPTPTPTPTPILCTEYIVSTGFKNQANVDYVDCCDNLTTKQVFLDFSSSITICSLIYPIIDGTATVASLSGNCYPCTTPTPTPSITPTNTVTPTMTPTPTPTPSTNCLFLASENLDNLMTENNDYLILYCP